MKIVLDKGNSTAKAGLFDQGKLIEFHYGLDLEVAIDFANHSGATDCLVCSVGADSKEITSKINSDINTVILTHTTPLPVKIDYKTPATLGVDRIAVAAGSQIYFENKKCLIIDMGTCITYDFIDDQKKYHGGGIAPGISIKFKSLNHFTANLPLISWDTEETNLVGDTTENSILSGVINGTIEEMNGIIDRYHDKFGEIKVILTGGDAKFFEKKLKGPIFVAQNLVLEGLHAILAYNA